MEKETPPLHSRDLQDTPNVPSEQRPAPRPHLSIDIPADNIPTPTPTPMMSISMTPPSTRNGSSNIPVTPTSNSIRPPSSRPPLRSPSFMIRQTVKSLLPAAGSFKLFTGGATKPSKVMSRTSSLPPDDALHAPPTIQQQKPASGAAAAVHHMCRSQSLPMSMKKLNNNTGKSFKRMDSLGGMYRVVPTTPRQPPAVVVADDIAPSDSGSPTTTGGEVDDDDGGEDIAEEEAVCRICMAELSESSEGSSETETPLLKLECACKGELALAHRDCAVKWFTIKGTRTCEVCKHDVQNLPVTLLRVQSIQQQLNREGGGGTATRYDRYRVWHGTPILVIISILAYFCFLEQLLVAHDGIAALAISLPFSCILGLFSSLTTTSMVARRYVWIYAAVQFLLVVFFTHLFYKYLHLQAVISIILATFAGFGVGMTGNSIVIEILRWRARRVAPPTQQARRHRRTRAPQQQAPPASDQPASNQPSAADVEVGQHNAMAATAAGDAENPPVPQA